MTFTATLSTNEIRSLLQSKIAQMSDYQVEKLHRVMQKLEAQQLWDEIKSEGAIKSEGCQGPCRGQA